MKTRIQLICAALLLLALPIHAQDIQTVPVQKDTTYIAIVMGGAVSLGAYEAGILAELFKQLDQHNNNPDADEFYVIDCMVGASAGSMSLALLAHEMFSNNGETFSVDGSSFYNAWVKEIDISRLLPSHRPGLKNDPFIFSTGAIDTIASAYLQPVDSPLRASFSPDTLYLCMTLSNMEGLPYEINYTNGRKLFHINPDKQYFRLVPKHNRVHVETMDGLLEKSFRNSWAGLSKTAIASGAFPFAFKPRDLDRDLDEYTIQPAVEASDLNYFYADGGYFNNDPINTALTLTRTIDERRAQQFSGGFSSYRDIRRRYIYLAPSDKPKGEHTRNALKDSLAV